MQPKGAPERYRAAVTGFRLLGVGIAAVLTVAGCAGPATGTRAPAAVASPSPSTGPPVPTGPPLGQPAKADNGQVEATVFAFRPVGAGWGAADVQVCVVANAIFDVTVSQGPWLLLLADGPGTPASPAPAGTLPQPAYPTDHRRIPPGGCVRGWLGFAMPAGARALAVQYSPAGAAPISWPVG
jgi:hypothetical protein